MHALLLTESCLTVSLRAVVCQAPLSMGVFRQEYWSRLLFPPPGLCGLCKLLSRGRLFATPWTVAHQASLSIESSRQEYWSGLLFPSPEELPNPGIKP